MADIADILTRVAREAAEVFREDFRASGYENSGQSMSQINAVDNKIMAPISVHTLVFGRKPGRYPPWGYEQGTSTPTSLMQWVMDRFGVAQKEARGLSFVIARKLMQNGSQIWQGIKPPLQTERTVQAAFDALMKEVGTDFAVTFGAVGKL